MKKQFLTAVLFAFLAFSACTSSSKQGASDSTSTTQDTTVSGDGTTGADTGKVPATGASSSAAIAGFDTSRAKLDTANTTPKQ